MKKTKVLIFFPVIIAFAFFSFTKPALNPIEKERKVLISTSYGDIKIRLYDETPLHRDNFIKLVSEGYYDGTLFHRVISQFMIQGGDPDSKGAKPDAILGNGGPSYTIPAEFISKYFHKKGAIAAAREPDNVNPNKASSGSQFYIVQGKKFTDAELDIVTTRTGHAFTKEEREVYKTVGGAPHLDGSYTVFGEVYEGIDVVDKIAAVKTGFADRPVEDVKMTVKIIE
jgi:cyclophilin family peptidyl-prolyl cis-trans isomerase